MSEDQIRSLQEIIELMDKVAGLLMNHNGDCYCDFCTQPETRDFQSKLILLHGELRNTLHHLREK